MDKTTVNVGSTVVDESLHQSITLCNNGALGTNYRLVKTNILRTEQTTAPQVIDNQKEEKNETLAVSGSIKFELYKLMYKKYFRCNRFSS